MVNKQSEKYEIFWSLQMNWNRKFIYKWTGIWISLLLRMNLILLKYNYHEWTEILWIKEWIEMLLKYDCHEWMEILLKYNYYEWIDILLILGLSWMNWNIYEILQIWMNWFCIKRSMKKGNI